MSVSSNVTSENAFDGLSATNTGTITLRILATTDLHGHLRGYDDCTGKHSPQKGLSRVATLMAIARQECRNTLLFDNGDFLQGSQLVDFWAKERRWHDDDIHPMISAMNALGYDGITLGNHEFNFGIKYLNRVLRDAKFPIVTTNISNKKNYIPSATPWSILHRTFTDNSGEPHDLRIGIIGLLPPKTVAWEADPVDFASDGHDLIKSATRAVSELRTAGADVIIALAHTGIEAPPPSHQQSENIGLQIARIAGLDAIVCGHSHLRFPDPDRMIADPAVDTARGTIGGTAAVMPGHHGSHLGVVDLVLRQDSGRWRPVYRTASLRPTLVGEHPDIVKLSQKDQQEITDHLSKPLGKIPAPIHSFFAMVAPTPTIDIVAEAQIACARERLRGTPDEDLPILSATAPAKTGGRNGWSDFIDIPSGPITLRDVMTMYAYPNFISVIKATGAEVMEWLEHAAGAFNQVTIGQRDVALVNPDFPSYNFDVMTGLQYEIDITQPRRYHARGKMADANARRIKSVMFQGRPVTADQVFMVATNNYRSAGAGGFPRPASRPLTFPNTDLRGLIHRHAEARGTLTTTGTPTWRFPRINGATTWFDTSPSSRTHVHEVDIKMDEIGITPQGFLRMRLHM